MLLAIREKVTGWIAYGIIFLISIPFALWGINSYLGGGEVPPAAVVNGEEISLTDFDRAYASYRQRLARLFGGSIPPSFGTEDMLRDQVLGQMIEEYALRQYVDDRHYRIGDESLNRTIRGMEVFQRDGQFDGEVYEAQLRSLGYSPLAFEQEMRVNGAMQQFQAGLQATAFTVPATQKKFSSLDNQTRKLRSLEYSIDADSVEISDEEIEQQYLARSDRYQTPEQVRIDYIDVSLDSIKQDIEVSRDDVYARYEASREAYTSPRTSTASHILITTASDEESDQALARIGEIRERIENGESFADLAREFSEDPSSAAEGGNLGVIRPGDMVPSFEAALDALEVGQLSEPVKTAFGWHLIRLEAVEGGETRSFESVQAELEDEIRTELAEGQIFDLVENLANIAYEQPESLQPAADQMGLELKTSDWFDRFSGDGIAADSRLRTLAFSDEVLRQGLNSEAIELGSDRIVFIRLNEHRPPQQKALEEVRDRIEAELRINKLQERNVAAGNAALEALRGGKTLDQLAVEWDREIVDHGFVGRDQEEVDAAIRQRAFRLPKPVDGRTYDGLTLAGGEYAIIELSAILSNDSETSAEALEGLNQAVANTDYRGVLNLLRERAEVVRTPLDELETDPPGQF